MSTEKKETSSKILATRGMPQVITAFACLVIIIAVFILINENFASERNLRNLLRQTAPLLIIGIAQSFVLITGNIDLSIGSIVGMGCMISATLMTRGISPVTASTITLICCLVVGIINGQLVARVAMPSFIATLSTMAVGRGIAQTVNKNRNTDSIGEVARAFRNFFYYGEQQFFGLRVFNIVLIAFFLWVIFNFILTYTKTGRNIYAVGDNIDAARMTGVNVNFTVTTAYVVSSFCACVVGLAICATGGMGTMDAGTMYELYAIAVSVIGGVSVLGGQGLLLGTIVGASILILVLTGLPVAIRNIAVGIIVVIAVLLDITVCRGKWINKKKKRNYGINPHDEE